MKDVLDRLYKKIEICRMGGETEWNSGFITGVEEAIDAITEMIYDGLMPWSDYFVIMYQDGDPYRPYVQEMRLYRITGSSTKSFYFTTNTKAINSLEIQKPDVILRSPREIRERVFFTKGDAEKSIGLR